MKLKIQMLNCSYVFTITRQEGFGFIVCAEDRTEQPFQRMMLSDPDQGYQSIEEAKNAVSEFLQHKVFQDTRLAS